MSFAEKIQNLKQQKLYRRLIPASFISDNIILSNKKKLTSFCSNDYLSLANNRKVKSAAIKAIKKYGTSSKSSRYIAGNNELYQKLENKLAKFYQKDDSIIFSSGYQASIGTIPALVTKGDLIIADKLIHSSLIDGSKLSNAKLIRYNHNDLDHLQKLLKENKNKYEKILIITESIFSMDGDQAPLSEIKTIAKKHNSLLLIDAAHSLYQKSSIKFNDENIILMGTFSKALGSFGGYIVSNSEIIDYLRNFAKSAIYTTALPPATLAANLKSLKIVSKKDLAKKTLANAQLLSILLNIPFTNSAIIIIEIDDVEKTLNIAEKLKQDGFLVSAIRPPTSPTARLRITVNAKHTKKQIENFAKNLIPLL